MIFTFKEKGIMIEHLRNTKNNSSLRSGVSYTENVSYDTI
jgi:hypothetical protein